MTARLTRARVLHRREYELADRGAFDILFDDLERRRATLVTGKDTLIRDCPAFHQIFWAADMSTISEGVDDAGRVMASVLVHQGAHSLTATALGDAIHRDPCLALLGEALASALNVYFAFEIMRQTGVSAEDAARAYAAPRTSKAGRRALARAYAGFPKDPLHSTRSITSEIWALYRAMHEIDTNPKLGSRAQLRAFRAHIQSMKNPWLVTRLDITNNYLFAKANYPLKFSPKRMDAAARHLTRWFAGATSVEHVLARMSGAKATRRA